MEKRFLVLPLICACLLGKAQTASMDAVLKTYAESYQPEKIHIHFDKDAYLPGETIWLKAYLMEGSKPSGHSKNIYFDWTDAQGNLLLHSVSPVLESSATTSFALPIDFNGGAIHVKSYTQWMLNFDTAFLFNKNIPVLSAWDGSPMTSEKHLSQIQFFPEGGDLVSGLSSIVAFEVLDQHGHPVNARGVIKSGSNSQVDSFATRHDGMGSFRLQPAPNEKYTAYWRDEFGGTHSSELPMAKSEGLVLRLNLSSDNTVHYQIERSPNAGDNFKNLTLMSTAQQKVLSKTQLDLKDNMISNGTIRTDQLPGPVIQVTVFDANMSPLAERVIFVNSQNYGFSTSIKNDLVNFDKKARNEISVEIPDGFSANLSVSVTDGGLASDSGTNIISDFLLNSDIRGNIINPAYYFNSGSDSARFYLDLVMRTHGWRRFRWEDILAGKLPPINYPAETEYMAFKGQVNMPNAHFDNSDSIALLLITKERKKSILSLPLNPDGSFRQKGLFFYDSVQVVYKMNHPAKLGSNADVNVQTSLLGSPISKSMATEPNFQWSKVPDMILEKEINGLLAELKNYSRQARGLDYVITPRSKTDSLKATSETAAHYLEGNFPSFKFPYSPKEGDGENENMKYASLQKKTGTPTSPAPASKYNINLVLDGNAVTMDDLKQVSMKEVLFIKILERTSPKDLPTLAISSRQSLDQNNIINNKTGFAVIKGYTPAKEFYVPQYSGTAADDQVPDYRSTLYWNPRVILDKDHRKVKLSFYNNDMSNKFRVIIEGMNAEGKLTRVEQIIK